MDLDAGHQAADEAERDLPHQAGDDEWGRQAHGQAEAVRHGARHQLGRPARVERAAGRDRLVAAEDRLQRQHVQPGGEQQRDGREAQHPLQRGHLRAEGGVDLQHAGQADHERDDAARHGQRHHQHAGHEAHPGADEDLQAEQADQPGRRVRRRRQAVGDQRVDQDRQHGRRGGPDGRGYLVLAEAGSGQHGRAHPREHHDEAECHLGQAVQQGRQVGHQARPIAMTWSNTTRA